jgi:hypothetical protein
MIEREQGVAPQYCTTWAFFTWRASHSPRICRTASIFSA